MQFLLLWLFLEYIPVLSNAVGKYKADTAVLYSAVTNLNKPTCEKSDTVLLSQMHNGVRFIIKFVQ